MHIPESQPHLLREAVGSTACASPIRAEINFQRGARFSFPKLWIFVNAAAREQLVGASV
jgi:hypothetical protein